jgi:hypothetical protein
MNPRPPQPIGYCIGWVEASSDGDLSEASSGTTSVYGKPDCPLDIKSSHIGDLEIASCEVPLFLAGRRHWGRGIVLAGRLLIFLRDAPSQRLHEVDDPVRRRKGRLLLPQEPRRFGLQVNQERLLVGPGTIPVNVMHRIVNASYDVSPTSSTTQLHATGEFLPCAENARMMYLHALFSTGLGIKLPGYFSAQQSVVAFAL